MKIKTIKKLSRIKKHLRLKRLKIAEQILIVLFIAVLIPMIISGIIINNINQQAMRAQLKNSAVLIANVVSNEIDVFWSTLDSELKQISFTLNNLYSIEQKQKYLDKTRENYKYFSEIQIVNTINEVQKIKENNLLSDKYTVYVETQDKKYLVASLFVEDINNYIFKSLKDDARQIYVVDSTGKIVAQHNYTEEVYKDSLNLLPQKITDNMAVIYGDIKNQPIVYIHKNNPEFMVIVNTTEKITRNTINDNRFKLLMAVFVSSLSIFIIVGLYIYYMYINIRQLFKAIMAITKGSYQRRIHLIKSIFTPYEVVFLASEFNKMVSEIHKSYIQLKKQNVELQKLNEFRSNLIDTVSHELRTPLTSIQGYTSRLLRTDIKIDEETQQKSLHIIKKQSERLKRLIEDLLIVPDIERAKIRVTLEPVWISDTVENAVMLVKNDAGKEIISNISEDFPLILSDKDRLEQVIVNLIENAIKYSYENTPIRINGEYNSNNVKIFIENDCDKIPQNKINSLFEKFIRLDDKTTRTTRGTGLGLFIVKGLVEAMNGTIEIVSNEEVGFRVNLTFPLFKSIEKKV
ncbi:MAG: sensor histidine kinase [Candidatus Gastranaerophilaceae bacterium]